MADRFYVGGGSGDWSNTDSWSTSSGGASGASVPGIADDVYLDANSGVGTLTVDGATIRNCLSLDCTGFTGTLKIGDGTNLGHLRVYANVTFVAGMTLTDGGNGSKLQLYANVVATFNMTSGGKTIPMILELFGIAAATLELQDNWVCSNDVKLHAEADSSTMVLNSATTETLECQGDLYYGIGIGHLTGNTKVKLTGTGDLILNTQTTSYQMSIDVEFTSGTRTIKGEGTIGIPTWTYVAGTVVLDSTLKIHLVTAGTFSFDFGTAAMTLPYLETEVSAAILRPSNSGHQLTITDYRVNAGHVHTIDNSGNTNALLITFWNSQDQTLANMGNQTFKGDITFDEFYCEWTTTSSTFTFDNTATYIFRNLFEAMKLGTGFYTFESDHATLTTNFHIWHNCRTHLYGLHCTRIDAISEGQGMVVQGETNITGCVGVSTESVNVAVKGIQGTTPIDHPFYTNPGKDLVTFSGTVQLSAVDQQDAEVIVVIEQTENGKRWFKLWDVLVTDVNGEYSTLVPRNCKVHAEVHYDSGSQKYNSESLPYVDIT